MGDIEGHSVASSEDTKDKDLLYFVGIGSPVKRSGIPQIKTFL